MRSPEEKWLIENATAFAENIVFKQKKFFIDGTNLKDLDISKLLDLIINIKDVKGASAEEQGVFVFLR